MTVEQGVCRKCGEELPIPAATGRPRVFCLACRPRVVPAVRVQRLPARCIECAVMFQPRSSRARFCSPKCRYRFRDRRDYERDRRAELERRADYYRRNRDAVLTRQKRYTRRSGPHRRPKKRPAPWF
jgi:hypothetical protein